MKTMSGSEWRSVDASLTSPRRLMGRFRGDRRRGRRLNRSLVLPRGPQQRPVSQAPHRRPHARVDLQACGATPRARWLEHGP